MHHDAERGEIVDLDLLTGKVIECAIRVHKELGAGLFEEVYKTCLRHELIQNNFKVESEVSVPVVYSGVNLDIGYRVDLLVEDSLILELKAVEAISSMHKAQLRTYLKLAKKQIGLLINFNVAYLKDGISRQVNGY